MPDLKEYIQSGELWNMEESPNLDELLKSIEDFVRETDKKGGISSSQIRNIFSKAKQAKKVNDLKMLQPKLAYVLARQDSKKTGAKTLISLLNDCIKALPNSENEKENKKTVKGFQTFFESLVAYHRQIESQK